MIAGVGLALTNNPVEAARQAVDQANKTLGGAAAQLAVLFASSHFLPYADALVATVANEAGSPPLIGCLAESVVGNGREVESEPAVSLWLGAGLGPVETFSMEFLRTPTGGAFCGYNFEPGVHLMVTDPYSFPVDSLLSYLNEHVPGALVMGGVASGVTGVGQGGLFLGDQVLAGGCVGVRLAATTGVELLVSQGCRPIGSPYTVTRAEGHMIYELGGRPPLTLLQHLARSLPERDQQLLVNGVHLGLVIDEYQIERGPGDFLIRGVIGADPRSGAIALGDEARIGQTVQFHVRDAHTADQDLKRTLEHGLTGRRVSGALLFTCNGRGSRLFDQPDHDTGLLAKVAGDIPVGGFFCGGELGPVGSKNFLHGFTASIAAFTDPAG
jgi:small ligand-binding sensory domain FIST